MLIRIRDADLSAIDWATSRLADDVRAVLFRALSKHLHALAECCSLRSRHRGNCAPTQIAGWPESTRVLD